MPKFNPRSTYDDGNGGSWKAAEDGEHVCVVTEAELGFSNAGNKMITLVAKVADKDDRSAGCKLREWFVIDPSWFGKLKDFCDAINPDMPGPDTPGGFDAESQQSIDKHWLGKLFVGKTYREKDTWNGKTTTKARFDRYGWRALTDDEQQRLAMQYGGDVSTAAPKRNRSADPFGDGAPPPSDEDFGGFTEDFGDDEIPF